MSAELFASMSSVEKLLRGVGRAGSGPNGFGQIASGSQDSRRAGADERIFRDALNQLWQGTLLVSLPPADVLAQMMRHFHACYQGLDLQLLRVPVFLYQGDAREALALTTELLSLPMPANLERVCRSYRAEAFALLRDHASAAQEFHRIGFFAKAALQHLAADRPSQAQTEWEALLHRLNVDAAGADLAQRSYLRGLLHRNIAVAAKDADDPVHANANHAAAVRELARAAHQFESTGRIERAYDAYLALASLGLSPQETKHEEAPGNLQYIAKQRRLEEGAFECVIEGYTNAGRILRHDGLFRLSVQHFARLGERAFERGEFRAAALAFSDAAVTAEQAGLASRESFLDRVASSYWESGRALKELGASVSLVENAWTAAAEHWLNLRVHAAALEVFEALAVLPVDAERQARYARVCNLLRAHAGNQETNVRRGYKPVVFHSPPEVWFDDVLEFEREANPIWVGCHLSNDPGSSPHTRFRGLLLELCGLEEMMGARTAGHQDPGAMLVEIASRTESYFSLAVLERLFLQHGSQRTSIIKALRRLAFKRSYDLVGMALINPKPVRELSGATSFGDMNLQTGLRFSTEYLAEIRQLLPSLGFRHALQPLLRLHRLADDTGLRTTLLETIARVGTDEAHEYLWSVMLSGSNDEKQSIVRSLNTKPPESWRTRLPFYMDRIDPQTKTLLSQLLGIR